MLYERDWDKQRIIDLFSVLDWMMQVPSDLKNELWQDIERLERNRAMPYITSVERIGIEKGLQLGMQLGMQLGIQLGMQQGESALLQKLLERRFGPLSSTLRERLAQAAPEQLEAWGMNLMDAASLDDVFSVH